MQKIMINENKRDVCRAANVIDAARVIGVSQRQGQRILAGEQQNEVFVDVFMFLQEGKNLLIEAAKNIVPFPKK